MGTLTCLAIIASCTIIVDALATQAYFIDDFASYAGPCLQQKNCASTVSSVKKGNPQIVHYAASALSSSAAFRLADTVSPSNPVQSQTQLQPIDTPSNATSRLTQTTNVSEAIQPNAINQQTASSSSVSATQAVRENCAPLLHTSYPVVKVPNWGAMHTPSEWNRSYSQMTADDFVAIPRYDLSVLTKPMSSFTSQNTDESIAAITAKLFYSTRYFGSYNIDAGQWTGTHAALDLKLAFGTPIGALGGGTVAATGTKTDLGNYVMIRHCTSLGVFYSIYGHFDTVFVKKDQSITPGQTIGTVGMTGETTAPHLHLAVDLEIPGETTHQPYKPHSLPSNIEAKAKSMHPLEFIALFRTGDN